MFELLKKKISGFIDGITKKEEKIIKEEKAEKKLEEKPVEIEKSKQEEIQKIEILQEESKKEKIQQYITKETKKEEKQEIESTREVEKNESEKNLIEKREEKQEGKKTVEKEFKPFIGIKQKISSIFTNTVVLEAKNLEPVFNNFKTSLLESDVSFSTADFMVDNLKNELIGKKVEKNKVNEEVKQQVISTLEKIFNEGGSRSFFGDIKSKPFIVLFVGTNGSGKTTTVAKIAWEAKKKNISSVMVAADTFRKAAIEQLSEHGENIKVPVIKRDYGADPASVAFDGVSYAKARGIDLVLIDTAGRQETNQNLVREMEKINRVVKPNLKIFVGESIAGNALVEQIKSFNNAIKLDGVILTKTDFDVKGGVLLSVFHEVKIPIFFTANGQRYEDLKDFNSNEMIKTLISG